MLKVLHEVVVVVARDLGALCVSHRRVPPLLSLQSPWLMLIMRIPKVFAFVLVLWLLTIFFAYIVAVISIIMSRQI